MSIFGKIMSSIFGKAQAAGASSDKAAPGAKPSSSAAATATAGSIRDVDVAGVLTKLAAEKREKLDWQKSIIDLMKLLDLDSSLSARKELAQELRYSGDTNDSASMNVWLHKQVMRKLAENGGKVPEELQVGHAGSTDINSSSRNEEQTTSVFGKIMSSIFGKANAAGAAPASGAKPSSATQGSAPAGSITEVDVAGILTKLVAEKKEKLDWQKSIIDQPPPHCLQHGQCHVLPEVVGLHFLDRSHRARARRDRSSLRSSQPTAFGKQPAGGLTSSKSGRG